MNYGVTVEGGQWPAAVMGKADDLKLFDKVNAVPNVPALRGDVVKMIDNSLTIKHLVQKGYGDLAYYDEGTDTFLSKMKVDEIDGRITSVDVKKNRVTITPDEDEEDITRPTTYEVIDDSVDVDGLLGVEVTVWANDDDEVFFVDPDMDAVKVDVIDEDVAKDADEVALRIADDEFDVASNVKVYINGESEDLEDLEAGMYGYFVFDDDDEIIYINVKDWNEVNAGVVTEVDENIISYFLETESESELDLEDPDDGYIIVLDGEAIDVDDIEKNDVIYVAEYDDMYYIIVVRNAVEGKVERIKDDEVKIDGKTYDVTNLTTYSLDEDDEIALYDADKAADLTGEEATAILDIAGDLRHITSAAEATSDEIFGVLTKVDVYNEVVKIFANGESKSYDIDGDIYKGDNVDAIKITDWDDLKAYTDGTTADYAIVMFELNKDGEIEDLFVLGGYKDNEFTASPNNNDYTVKEYTIAEDGFDDKHDVIDTKTPKDAFFVKSTTKFIDEIDDMDDVKWEDIESKDVPANKVKAIIVSNDKGDAELVVFTKGFSEIAEEEELGVVLDKFVEDGDWKATIAVYEGEEKDYLLDSKNDVNIGETIKFRVNSDNELTDIVKLMKESSGKLTGYDVAGLVENRDGSYITVNGVKYKADSLTLIYDVGDSIEDIDNAKLSDIKEDKSYIAMLTDGKLIKALYIVDADYIGEGGTTPPDDGNDVVINADVEDATFGSLVTVTVTNKPADAEKYQVFDGSTPISAVTNIGAKTTVFPKKAAGDTVTVKLFKADGTTVVLTQSVELK
jgi:hypothetical protein